MLFIELSTGWFFSQQDLPMYGHFVFVQKCRFLWMHREQNLGRPRVLGELLKTNLLLFF
jgi:hypothetical protein